jgi:galactokinase
MTKEYNYSSDLLPFFHQRFGQPDCIVKSPGRINLLGEHTDYNLGYVMPAAIDLAIYIVLNRREDNKLHWFASDLNQYYEGRKDNLIFDNKGWPNYWLGAILQLEKSGYTVTGFNAVVAGNLPVGAGLSSSAALTCGILFALNKTFDFKIPILRLIQMAQATEHEFIGLQCGIMDQFACMMGKADQLILLDCRTLDHRLIPCHLSGMELLLLDTGVKHSLASSEYNGRKVECQEGVKLIQQKYPVVQSLRDASEEMIIHTIPARTKIYKRCLYVVQENDRVLAAARQLLQGDMIGVGQNMFATHNGLRDLYEVSFMEADFLVSLALETGYITGARMMGGGFGGCVLVLLAKERRIEFIENCKKRYQQKFNRPLFDYSIKIEKGAGLL